MDLLPPPFHLLPRPLQRWLSRGRFIVQLFKWILFYFLLYFVCTIIGMLILGIHFPTSYDESNLIYEKLRSKNGADSHVQQGNRVTTRDISFINLLDGNYTGCTGRNGSDLQICRTEHMSLLVVLPIISIVIFCGLCLVVLECLRYRRKRIAPFFIDPKAGSEQSFGPFLENNASPRTGDDEDDVERQMREVPRERSEHCFTLDGTIDGWTNWISKNHENQVSSWRCSNTHIWLFGPADLCLNSRSKLRSGIHPAL
jgi:hypothetical protein